MSSILKKIGDWHSHNKRCNHATGELEDYIESAINKGLGIIGLSDHFPTHYSECDGSLRLKQFAMDMNEVQSYIDEAVRLKIKYKDLIDVKIGFEVGYLQGKEEKYFNRVECLNGDLDYIIGSVHNFKLYNKYWGVKSNDMNSLIEKYGARLLYSKYFQAVKSMLLSKRFDFDIIGHLDYVKNGKESGKLNDFIFRQIKELVPLIKEKEVAVEINTQGMRNCYNKLYHCKLILKMLHNFDIPLVLSSDAHNPADLGFGFHKVLDFLKEIGHGSILNFEKRVPYLSDFTLVSSFK